MKNSIKIYIKILDFKIKTNENYEYRLCWKKINKKRKKNKNKKMSKRFTIKNYLELCEFYHKFNFQKNDSEETNETEIKLLVKTLKKEKIKLGGKIIFNLKYYIESNSNLFRQKLYFDNCPDKNAFLYLEIRKEIIYKNNSKLNSTNSSLNDTMRNWNCSLLSKDSILNDAKNEYYLKEDIIGLNKENNDNQNFFSIKNVEKFDMCKLKIKKNISCKKFELENIKNTKIDNNIISYDDLSLKNIKIEKEKNIIEKKKKNENIINDNFYLKNIESSNNKKIDLNKIVNKQIKRKNSNDNKYNEIKRKYLQNFKKDLVQISSDEFNILEKIKKTNSVKKKIKNSNKKEDLDFSDISSLNNRKNFDFSFHSKKSVKNDLDFVFKTNKRKSLDEKSLILKGSRMTFSNIDLEEKINCDHLQEIFELKKDIINLKKINEKQNYQIKKNEFYIKKIKKLEKINDNSQNEINNLKLENEKKIKDIMKKFQKAKKQSQKNEQRLKFYDFKLKMEESRSNKMIKKDFHYKEIKNLNENIEDYKIENEEFLKINEILKQENLSLKKKNKNFLDKIDDLEIKINNLELEKLDLIDKNHDLINKINNSKQKNLLKDKNENDLKEKINFLKENIKISKKDFEEKINYFQNNQEKFVNDITQTRKKIAECLDFLGQINLKKIKKKEIIQLTIDILVNDN